MKIFLILFSFFLMMITFLLIFYLLNYKKCKNCKYYEITNETKGICYKKYDFPKIVNYDFYCEFFKLL